MVRINVLEGIRPPLPPATLVEILQVCAASLAFAAVAAGLIAGVVALLLN
jgi:hypothetical protein